MTDANRELKLNKNFGNPAALAFECPYCRAPAGAMCSGRTHTSAYAYYSHKTREKLTEMPRDRHEWDRRMTLMRRSYQSLGDSKSEVLARAKELLQVSPYILAALYIFEYLYVFQYLGQFGVTPEQVGISQIKLVTRAGIFTLFVLSIIGIAPIIVSMTIAGLRSINESRYVRPILLRFNLIEQPKTTGSSHPAEVTRLAAQRARNVRIGAAVTFGAAIGLTILLMKPLGDRIAASGIIFLIVLDVALSMFLFLEWRRRSKRYLILACGALFGAILLGLTAFFGATYRGFYAAEHGYVPGTINALGIDILQVHPVWLDKRVIPPKYRGQDLLELGSDSGTVFLYDCWTGTTYRIPLTDLAMSYPLNYNQTTPATIKSLHCRQGSQ